MPAKLLSPQSLNTFFEHSAGFPGQVKGWIRPAASCLTWRAPWKETTPRPTRPTSVRSGRMLPHFTQSACPQVGGAHSSQAWHLPRDAPCVSRSSGYKNAFSATSSMIAQHAATMCLQAKAGPLPMDKPQRPGRTLSPKTRSLQSALRGRSLPVKVHGLYRLQSFCEQRGTVAVDPVHAAQRSLFE